MKELKNPFWRMAAEYGVITLSIWIMVVGIYFFKFPNHFAFGGVTGFSTVVSEATRWSAGDFTFIVNTALLLLGFISLERDSALRPFMPACLCLSAFPCWSASALWPVL